MIVIIKENEQEFSVDTMIDGYRKIWPIWYDQLDKNVKVIVNRY